MKKFLLILVMVVLLSACATGVTRIDAGTVTDLTGYWNDTDVRIVCEALVADILNSPRVNMAIGRLGREPVVLVGRFRNESSEHIDTAIITTNMETAIFNSGRMNFVAGGAIREELRAERQDQLFFTSEQTAASLANETGADFMLFGTVRSIVERAGNETIRTYFVSAELTNLETNERMWMGQHNDIKKRFVQPRNRP